MTLRDIFVENFAGDLEYHPRRAVLYFALAVAAFCLWIFSPSNMQFTTVPLVFGLGGLALLMKGIFLMRKSSEGLGLSDQELAKLSDPSNRKRLPSLAAQVSQIVQDFAYSTRTPASCKRLLRPSCLSLGGQKPPSCLSSGLHGENNAA